MGYKMRIVTKNHTYENVEYVWESFECFYVYIGNCLVEEPIRKSDIIEYNFLND